MPPIDLAHVRQSMLALLAPCSEEHQLRGALKIARAGSAVDLWLLRIDLYQYLAQDIGQSEAAAKVAGLQPLFGSAVPDTAAVRKNPDNSLHGRHQQQLPFSGPIQPLDESASLPGLRDVDRRGA